MPKTRFNFETYLFI